MGERITIEVEIREWLRQGDFIAPSSKFETAPHMVRRYQTILDLGPKLRPP